MGDLISREELLEEIKKDLKEKDTSGNTAPFITGLIYRQFDIEKIIEEQPQVEAVPVAQLESVLKEAYLEIANGYSVSDLQSDSDKVACVASKLRQTVLDKLRTSAK